MGGGVEDQCARSGKEAVSSENWVGVVLECRKWGGGVVGMRIAGEFLGVVESSARVGAFGFNAMDDGKGRAATAPHTRERERGGTRRGSGDGGARRVPF